MKTLVQIEDEITIFIMKNSNSTAKEIGTALKITPKMLNKILKEMVKTGIIDEIKE